MTWSDVPEADRLEQERDVTDDEVEPEPADGAPIDVPLDAPADDVVEQHQVVPFDDDERRS